MATSDIPSWLNQEFVKLALDDEEEGIEIRNLDIVRPELKGNNYTTTIYRINVEYECKQGTKDISLIVKSPHEVSMNELIATLGFYSKEVLVYKKLLPKMNNILNGTEIAPKVYTSTRDEVLVMEDLKKNGYLMADRKKQLDFDHAVLVFTLLAKFHAASVKILEEDPDLIQEVGKECLLKAEHSWGKDSVSTFTELLLRQVENWPESKKYANSIRKNSEGLYERICEVIATKNDFLVLNHGDLWTTNMLFKYDESKPVSVKFLDFQVCRYNNPVYDIIYFLSGSVQENVRTEKLDDLLNIYVDVLNSELERLGVDRRITYPELKKWMDDRKLYTYYIGTMVMPCFFADESDVVDVPWDKKTEDFFSTENNPMEFLFKSKTLIKILPNRLTEMEKIGLLVPEEDN